ncbi:TolC family outer membrane protein [Hydrogenophaga sp. RWCD_12]|uniref:TolC family outer membrane protein n=1 Tax=Hydrogenophaga sp. RWCD_12 TaxID=3391190 RepID=UPI003984C5F3
MNALPSVSRFPALSRLSLAVALVVGASGAQAQSLVELYDAARGYDTTLQAARAQYDANFAKAEQARAGLRPQAGLAAGANAANSRNDVTDSSRVNHTQNITLSASQPLYRPANKIADEQGQLSIEIARAQLEAAEQDLMVRTAQAYFDVLAAQDTLTVVQAQKTAVSEQLASAKRNFEVGTSTVTDSREAQARYDLVIAQEIAASNDLRVKKLALDQLVGRTGASPKPLAAPVVLPNVQPTEVDTWVSEAQKQHPLVRQAQTALDIAELEARKAQAGHKPTLDLVGQYQIARGPNSNFPTVPNVRTNVASIGVQFNLPLYAGSAITNRVKEAVALSEKARADRETALRSIAQAVRSAYYGVVSGAGQVKALEAAETSSQSALDANKLGYQVGVRINIDVLNAQSQLYQTKRDLAVARYNVLVGQLRLKQAGGVLKADDLQPINALLK